MSEFPLGIDLSSYQFSQDGKRKPNFDIINAKCEFVAVRAGISWGYQDKWFRYSWDNIKVPRMAYHVIYPGESAISQMQHFLNIVRPIATDRLVLDVELDHGQTKTKITDTLIKCLEYVREHTGRYPIVYSRASWIDQFVYVSQLPDVDWWLAHYLKALPYPQFTPEKTPPPLLPKGVTKWLIHQTCEKGNGAEYGVASYYVDYDRWNGDDTAVLAYFGYDGPIEPPPEPEPPDPDEPLFEGIVTAEPYLNIRALPTTQSADLGDLFPGRRLNVYEIVPNWYRMRTVDEPYQAGWVASAYVARDWGGGLIETPLFSQKDPLWRYKKLGTSASTIGGYGCLLTSAAMVCAHYGKATNPDLLNQAMIRVNGYANGNLWKFWSLSAVYPDITIRDYVDCEKVPAPLALIDMRLAEGIPVIVKVDYYPGGAVQQHWILLCGKQGDDYIAADPISGTRILFREKYGDPARYIFRVVTYVRRGL